MGTSGTGKCIFLYDQDTDMVRHGKSPEGKQRYRCRQCREQKGRTFLLDYSYAGQSPEVKEPIVEMAMHASGIRRYRQGVEDQPHHGFERPQKKEPALQTVNHARLAIVHPDHVEVEGCRADERNPRCELSSALDELWRFVKVKSNPRWLWHAIDHHTGAVLAYVFGRRQDAVFLPLKALLEPLGITRYDTDGWGAYERHLEPDQHTIGKDYTQKDREQSLSGCGRGSNAWYAVRSASQKQSGARSGDRTLHQPR